MYILPGRAANSCSATVLPTCDCRNLELPNWYFASLRFVLAGGPRNFYAFTACLWRRAWPHLFVCACGPAPFWGVAFCFAHFLFEPKGLARAFHCCWLEGARTKSNMWWLEKRWKWDLLGNALGCSPVKPSICTAFLLLLLLLFLLLLSCFVSLVHRLVGCRAGRSLGRLVSGRGCCLDMAVIVDFSRVVFACFCCTCNAS